MPRWDSLEPTANMWLPTRDSTPPRLLCAQPTRARQPSVPCTYVVVGLEDVGLGRRELFAQEQVFEQVAQVVLLHAAADAERVRRHQAEEAQVEDKIPADVALRVAPVIVAAPAAPALLRRVAEGLRPAAARGGAVLVLDAILVRENRGAHRDRAAALVMDGNGWRGHGGVGRVEFAGPRAVCSSASPATPLFSKAPPRPSDAAS